MMIYKMFLWICLVGVSRTSSWTESASYNASARSLLPFPSSFHNLLLVLSSIHPIRWSNNRPTIDGRQIWNEKWSKTASLATECRWKRSHLILPSIDVLILQYFDSYIVFRPKCHFAIDVWLFFFFFFFVLLSVVVFSPTTYQITWITDWIPTMCSRASYFACSYFVLVFSSVISVFLVSFGKTPYPHQKKEIFANNEAVSCCYSLTLRLRDSTTKRNPVILSQVIQNLCQLQS